MTMGRKSGKRKYVVCVGNRGYPASLIVRRIYRTITDPVAERRRLVRVVDESGEDYLFPSALFVAVDLPKPLERAIVAAPEGQPRSKRGMPSRPARSESRAS